MPLMPLERPWRAHHVPVGARQVSSMLQLIVTTGDRLGYERSPRLQGLDQPRIWRAFCTVLGSTSSSGPTATASPSFMTRITFAQHGLNA